MAYFGRFCPDHPILSLIRTIESEWESLVFPAGELGSIYLFDNPERESETGFFVLEPKDNDREIKIAFVESDGGLRTVESFTVSYSEAREELKRQLIKAGWINA